jgi:Cu(I)/Ag(I) efflux system membrane protein CusA/SilA
MIGGMVSSTILMLVVISAVYGLIKGRKLPAKMAGASDIDALALPVAAE